MLKTEGYILKLLLLAIPSDFSEGITDHTKIRFRCDASSNLDWVFIDDINISGCLYNNNFTGREIEAATNRNKNQIKALAIYPNPAKDILNAVFDLQEQSEVQMIITNFSGKQILQKDLGTIIGQQKIQIDASNYSAGFYFLLLITKDKRIRKKFVITR